MNPDKSPMVITALFLRNECHQGALPTRARVQRGAYRLEIASCLPYASVSGLNVRRKSGGLLIVTAPSAATLTLASGA